MDVVEVQILEQPASDSNRFKYITDNRPRSREIRGADSTEDYPTFVALSVHTPNYAGPFYLIVSCVLTEGARYMPHPNSLLGENCINGIYKRKFESNSLYPKIISFTELYIQRTSSSNVETKLNVRESFNIDPFRTGFSHKHKTRRELKTLLDTKEVRLCFQVFLTGGQYVVPVYPVVSNVIRSKKQGNKKKLAPNSHIQQRDENQQNWCSNISLPDHGISTDCINQLVTLENFDMDVEITSLTNELRLMSC